MSALTLIEAVKTSDNSAVQTLINNGVDIEQADDYGWTALNWAAGKGDTTIIQQLLNAGANVANTGRDNRTAYQIALAAAHVDSALILHQAEQKRGLRTASHPYCKVYPIQTLRQFSDWSETPDVESNDIVYLHQDLSVTRCIWYGEEVVFRSTSLAWEKFCSEDLAFFVPTDLSLAAAFASEAVQS